MSKRTETQDILVEHLRRLYMPQFRVLAASMGLVPINERLHAEDYAAAIAEALINAKGAAR